MVEEDDGAVGAYPSGTGLRALEGKLRVESSPGAGKCIRAVIPLPQ